VPDKFRPKAMPLGKRLYRASQLLAYLNIKFPGLSISAATQIYTRYQKRSVRWRSPFQKLEKFIVVCSIQFYFLLRRKVF
jgi:hypothetical protein